MIMLLIGKFERRLRQRRGVIHVGAHEGQERIWYRKYRFHPVLWFEPNPQLYERLLVNISLPPYKDQNHLAYNVGIHDTLNKAILHISSNDGQSSSILDLGLHADIYPKVKYVRDVEIDLMRIDSFFENSNKDINDYNMLNVDVQGVELNVMKSFGDLIGKLDYVYAEINKAELYKGCALLGEIDEYLDRFGFIRSITETHNKWGDAFYIKKYLV